MFKEPINRYFEISNFWKSKFQWSLKSLTRSSFTTSWKKLKITFYLISGLLLRLERILFSFYKFLSYRNIKRNFHVKHFWRSLISTEIQIFYSISICSCGILTCNWYMNTQVYSKIVFQNLPNIPIPLYIFNNVARMKMKHIKNLKST